MVHTSRSKANIWGSNATPYIPVITRISLVYYISKIDDEIVGFGRAEHPSDKSIYREVTWAVGFDHIPTGRLNGWLRENRLTIPLMLKMTIAVSAT